MNTKLLTSLAIAGLVSTSWMTSSRAQTVEETYAGKIEFQDQTITKETAEMLHRKIALQRASQLVLWAMPVTSFYQLYGAFNSNLNVDPNNPVIGLCEGYEGVYPYLTANVTRKAIQTYRLSKGDFTGGFESRNGDGTGHLLQ